jgi:hypothetical protein
MQPKRIKKANMKQIDYRGCQIVVAGGRCMVVKGNKLRVVTACMEHARQWVDLEHVRIWAQGEQCAAADNAK